LFREELTLLTKTHGDGHLDLARSLQDLGSALGYQGKLAEAEASFRETLAIQKKRLGSKHPDVIRTLDWLAYVLEQQRKPAEAEALRREAFDLVGMKHGQGSREAFESLTCLVRNLASQQGKLAEAEASLRETLAIQRKRLGGKHPDVIRTLDWLAYILEQQRRLAEAEVLRREALELVQVHRGQDSREAFESLTSLVRNLASQQRSFEAEGLAYKSLTALEKLCSDQWGILPGENFGGELFPEWSNPAESEQRDVSGQGHSKQGENGVLAPTKISMREAMNCLIQLYDAIGRTAKGSEWRQELAEYEKLAPAGKSETK